MYEATKAEPEADIHAGRIVTRVAADCPLREEYPEAGWEPVSGGPTLFARSEIRDSFGNRGRRLVDEGELLQELKERLRIMSEQTSEERKAELERIVERGDPANFVPADGAEGKVFDGKEWVRRPDRAPRRDTSPGGEARDAALRMVEQRSGELSGTAADRLDDVIRRDAFGVDCRYIESHGSDAYRRAFAKKVLGAAGGETALEADEVAALQQAGRSMAERAMALKEGKLGAYGVPLTLDPTILLTNDGAVNPIRELATVTTITSHIWQGVSSKGVAFEFKAEATEAEDAAPELGQPEVVTERAQCWIPYSIEVGEDYAGLEAELSRLLADAKSVKEAEVFATGKGSENIPQGLITGATKIVESGTKEVIKIGDVYSLQEALAARWMPRATWLGTNKMANAIHKMVAQADATNAPIMGEARDSILGKPYREVSTMSTKITTKTERVLAFGDIASAYRIVDRLGMAIEVVPTVFGKTNLRPTGQRGLFAYFRVGAKVQIPEAVQVLAVKNE